MKVWVVITYPVGTLYSGMVQIECEYQPPFKKALFPFSLPFPHWCHHLASKRTCYGMCYCFYNSYSYHTRSIYRPS